jgi:PEP-CTERM motif
MHFPSASLRIAGAALVVLLLIHTTPAHAGFVTFNDLIDTVTVTDGTGGRIVSSCPGNETCAVVLFGPSGASSSSVAVLGSFLIAEPNANVRSDQIDFGPRPGFPNQVNIFFSSDMEGVTPLACPCDVAEDGTVQTARTIAWFNALGASIGSDDIKFQSDISDVPEPSSGLLMVLGVALLGLTFCRVSSGCNAP